MTTDNTDDRVESLLEDQQATIERQERVIRDLRETVENQRETIETLESRHDGDLQMSRRSALKATGILGLLGAGVGTASADSTGQAGAEGQPLETLYVDAVDGPLTDGQELTSLVGDGLTLEDGTLTADVDSSPNSNHVELEITEFDAADISQGESFTHDITLQERAGCNTAEITISLDVEQDGETVGEATVEGVSLDANGERTLTIGEDGGSAPIDGLNVGEHTTTVTVTAPNATDRTAESAFAVTGNLSGDIETWTDLDRVRDDLDATYTLAADLDENTDGYGGDGEDGVVLNADGELRDGVGFDPIGSFDDPFTGTFEGDGYTISGLEISTDSNKSGLFAANYGTIRDLTLDVEIEGDNDSVGGIAGAVESPGRIVNSSVTGTIEGNNKVGGIVGLLLDGGSIKGSSAGCDVSGNSYVGGLVGHGNVEDSTQTNIEILSSHATGAVTGTGKFIGGLAGRLGGVTVKKCYATGSVDGSRWVGGFLGYGSVPQIRECFAAGDVSGDEILGGFAGHTAWSENEAQSQNFETGRVTRCYAIGDVSGGTTVGGFTGMGNQTYFSYSVGEVSGSSDGGGFAGGNFTQSAYCYWDIPASGLWRSAGPKFSVTGIGERNGTPPADDMVGDGTIGGDFRNLRVRKEFETVEASDPDVSEDGYPVLGALDRETQLEVRE